MEKEMFTSSDVRSSYKGIVVSTGGPPHSGKSVFLAELYRQMLARNSTEVFCQRACPDGEGMWSNESDPDIVAKIRKKWDFSKEFVLFTLKSIETLGKQFPIVLVDLGGKRTAENAEILKRSTHLIVLSSEEKEFKPWQMFATAEGCKTIAVFASRLVKLADESLSLSVKSSINLANFPVQGEFLNLDRDAGKDPYSSAIAQFAEWLLKNAKSL